MQGIGSLSLSTRQAPVYTAIYDFFSNLLIARVILMITFSKMKVKLLNKEVNSLLPYISSGHHIYPYTLSIHIPNLSTPTAAHFPHIHCTIMTCRKCGVARTSSAGDGNIDYHGYDE